MIPFIKGQKKLGTFIRRYKKPIIIFALILIACFACSGCKKHTHVYTETTIFPTCSEQGYTLHTCSCGENYKDNYQKPKGHAFDKYGICSACGATRQIEVKLYVDGSYSQSVYTDSDNGYKIAVPDTPEDITSNPNSEKYFYGWFIDPNFQTPLIADTTFRSNASIYAKWITVYSNNFKYTVNYGVATITGYVGGAPTVLVIPSYINSFPVKAISRGAFENETVIRTVIICNGIETISGFKGCNSIVDIRIPKSVKTIGCGCFENCGFVNYIIPDGITSIDDLAFSGCEKLTNIIIPNSVTSIGDGAFYGCTGLKNITIPNSVTSIEGAFSGCTGLEKITIPNSVTSIGKEAFRGCTGLKNITIPNSVTSIGWGAFYGCTGLKNITIPNSVTSIDSRAFEGCSGLTSVTIGNSVTSIGSVAFRGCSGLTSVTIPDSVTSIGDSAFDGCNELESITLPFIGAQLNGNEEKHFGYIFFVGYFHDNKGVPSSLKTVIISNSSGVTSIGEEAFRDCTGLKNITIPNSVTSIGEMAFDGCSGLTSVTIPDSVTSIGRFAFSGCSSLTSVTIPDSVTSIGEHAFGDCTGLTRVIWNAENCRIVGLYSYPIFENCSKITNVTIGENVKTIPESAFRGCSSLTSVTIGNSVTSIGRDAFGGCSGLTSVTIPDSVTSIGDHAFV